MHRNAHRVVAHSLRVSACVSSSELVEFDLIAVMCDTKKKKEKERAVVGMKIEEIYN
jgi:hypothetical protein